MFSLSLDIFQELLVPDQRTIDRATSSILEASKHPEFILFLIESLQKGEVRQNNNLTTQIILQIVNLIRSNWIGRFNDIDPSKVFWSQESQEHISLLLLDLMFNIKMDLRSHFFSAFRIIILKSFPKVLSFMEKLLEFYHKRSDCLEDVFSFLNLCYFWGKACSDRKENAYEGYYKSPEDMIFDLDAVNTKLLECYSEIVSNVISLVETNESACMIVTIVSKIIRRSTYVLSSSLMTPLFNDIISQIINPLSINSSDEIILKMKYQIFKMIHDLNQNYLKKSSKYNDEIKLAYSTLYKTQIAPQILQITIQCLKMPTNFIVSSKILEIFYQFIFYSICKESLLTSDFVSNILLRYSRITSDDINQSEINPCYYLDTCLYFDEGKAVSPRYSCSKIVRVISRKKIAYDFYQMLLTRPLDVFDFEAKIFLLIYFMKAQKSLLKEKKNKKRNSKLLMNYEIPEELITLIINELSEIDKNPTFLNVTLIWFFADYLKKIEPITGFDIANQIMIYSNQPIIVFAASRLLVKCYRYFEGHRNVNLQLTLQKLLENIPIFNSPITSKAIELICENSTENIDDELIVTLFNIAIKMISLDEEMIEGVSSIFSLIASLIRKIEDDSPILIQLAEFVIPVVFNIFSNYPNNSVYTHLFDIISTFSIKFENAIPIQIQSLPNLFSLLLSDISLLDATRELVWYLYPIVCAKNNPLSTVPELLQPLLQLSDNMYSNAIEENDFEREGYSLLLKSCFIQVFEDITESIFNQCIQTLHRQMEIYQNEDEVLDEPIPFIGGLYVLAASLIINEQQTLQNLPKELVDFIISAISKTIISSYREMTISFIILLSFYKVGIQKAYIKAGKLYEKLYQLKEDEESFSEYQEEEEEEYDNSEEDCEGEIMKLIAPSHMPLDNINPFLLFIQVTKEYNSFDLLSSKYQEIIANINSKLNFT